MRKRHIEFLWNSNSISKRKILRIGWRASCASIGHENNSIRCWMMINCSVSKRKFTICWYHRKLRRIRALNRVHRQIDRMLNFLTNNMRPMSVSIRGHSYQLFCCAFIYTRLFFAPSLFLLPFRMLSSLISLFLWTIGIWTQKQSVIATTTTTILQSIACFFLLIFFFYKTKALNEWVWLLNSATTDTHTFFDAFHSTICPLWELLLSILLKYNGNRNDIELIKGQHRQRLLTQN